MTRVQTLCGWCEESATTNLCVSRKRNLNERTDGVRKQTVMTFHSGGRYHSFVATWLRNGSFRTDMTMVLVVWTERPSLEVWMVMV